MTHSRAGILVMLACVGGWGMAAGMAGCGGDGATKFGGEGAGGEMSASGGRSAGGVTGSAGALGTGAAMGSGGGGPVGGAGGHANTGGGGGSGGMAATGGRFGGGGRSSMGGATGTGGRPATGGTVGSGGAGTMGSGGAGGTGGVNTATCDDLAAEYQKELPSAKSCALAAMVKQCQISVPSGLGCGSNCKIYVQSAGRLAEIGMAWTNAGCDSILRLCPAIACIQSTPGNCAPTGGLMGPQCQQGPTTLP